MRLMISQPMKGKTLEEIKEERAELVKGLEELGHEVADTIYDKAPDTEHTALYDLGRSLMDMAGCDGVVFMPGWKSARGCSIEHTAAVKYGLFVMEA